jgi:hypothetical protein
MRLPYLQVTQETWEYARQLEVLTGVDMPKCFVALCDVWRWAISLGPEDQPPSGVCDSPRADKLLAAAAGWRGDPAEFVGSLEDLGIVQRLPVGLRVRGMDRYRRTWEKNRRKPARTVPETGTNPAPPAPEPARQIETQTQTQIEISKEEKALSTSSTALGFKLEPCAPPIPAPVVEVFEHWARKTGHTRSKLDPKRQKVIADALALGYSPADLKQAVDGCLVTPHNVGQNDRATKYDSLALILRDGDQVDRFMRNAKEPPRPPAVRDKRVDSVAERVRAWDGVGPGGGPPPPDWRAGDVEEEQPLPVVSEF